MEEMNIAVRFQHAPITSKQRNESESNIKKMSSSRTKTFSQNLQEKMCILGIFDICYVASLTATFYINYLAVVILIVKYMCQRQLFQACVTLIFVTFSFLGSTIFTTIFERKFYQKITRDLRVEHQNSIPGLQYFKLSYNEFLVLLFAILGCRPAQRAIELACVVVRLRRIGKADNEEPRAFLQKLGSNLKYNIVLAGIMEIIFHCTPQIIAQIVFLTKGIGWSMEVTGSAHLLVIIPSIMFISCVMSSFFLLKADVVNKEDSRIPFEYILILGFFCLVILSGLRLYVMLLFTSAFNLYILVFCICHWIFTWVFLALDKDIALASSAVRNIVSKGLFAILYTFVYIVLGPRRSQDCFMFSVFLFEVMVMYLLALFA